jgi:diacylglycerol kinase (ATP)
LSSKHALVIYNPTAGTVVDLDVSIGSVIHTLCKERGYSVTVRPTSPNIGRPESARLLEGTFDLIVAAGGDGTIRLVLGAVSERAPETPVAIIPLGTGNQLARNLKIFEENLLTDALDEAIEVMLEGRPLVIDLGTMNGEYFCVAAGAGPISDAIITPSRQEKASYKMLAYVGSMIQTLALPPVIFRVKTGAIDFQVSASGVFVTNCGELGVGTLSDTAELNDGLLDLCIMNPHEFTDYLQLGFHFVSGSSIEAPPYYIRKVTTVDLEVVPVRSRLSDFQAIAHKVRTALRGQEEMPPAVPDQVTAMVDGDAYGTTPMTIKVIPNAVQVLTPF